MVCTLSAMAGWGLAYYRFCSKSAAIEPAEFERQKADAATPAIFAEGDKIPLPKECVYGHNTLKDVQIIWGHPWDLDELREKVERHEVVLSGTDVIGPKAKSHTVYCPVCDFTLEMGYRPWTRTSKDAASFVQPFSVLVTSFPLLEEVLGQQNSWVQSGSGSRPRL
jgi:hypothetical protein